MFITLSAPPDLATNATLMQALITSTRNYLRNKHAGTFFSGSCMHFTDSVDAQTATRAAAAQRERAAVASSPLVEAFHKFDLGTPELETEPHHPWSLLLAHHTLIEPHHSWSLLHLCSLHQPWSLYPCTMSSARHARLCAALDACVHYPSQARRAQA
jgi:hypothetical protein